MTSATPTTPAVPVLTEAALAELEAIRAQMPALELGGGRSDKPVGGEFDYGITAIVGGHTRIIAEVFGKVAPGLPMPANVIGANFIAAVNALPALVAEVRALRARCEEKDAALGRFSEFLAMLEAHAECAEMPPLEDREVLMHFMGSGASDVLTVANFRAARAAITPGKHEAALKAAAPGSEVRNV